MVGGTFDPVHRGHLALAEAALRCARLDRVLLVPAAAPPHRDPARASAQDRLRMCRLAAGGDPKLEVSDLELRRQGPSYTVETLAELARQNPGAELFLVLGWDAARELRSWQQPERVLEQATLVIVPRPRVPGPVPAELSAAGIDPARTLICRERTPAVSSTEVRQRLAKGEDPAGLVGPAVAGYIREHGLYAPGTGA